MSDRFRITLMCQGATSDETVRAADVTERLRQIGLEWKTADFFHDKPAVVVITPADSAEEVAALRAQLQQAREALDG